MAKNTNRFSRGNDRCFGASNIFQITERVYVAKHRTDLCKAPSAFMQRIEENKSRQKKQTEFLQIHQCSSEVINRVFFPEHLSSK